MRALNVLVSLSMVASGLLGLLASREVQPDQASPLSDIARAPAGARLVVRGMLERLRPVAGGAVLSSVTDCAGNRAPVFFPKGAGAAEPFSLVTLEGTLQDYKGAREIVVAGGADVRAEAPAATVLTLDELSSTWTRHLCTHVGTTGPIAWAAVSAADARDVEVGLAMPSGQLLVVVHLDAYPALNATVGASVTFLGVLAASQDGLSPVLHVRA